MLKDMADSKRIDDRIQGDITVSVLPAMLTIDICSSSDHFEPLLARNTDLFPPSPTQTTKVSRIIALY